jgi:hypothetical protein
MRPLSEDDGMRPAGNSAAALVKANSRLSSFERLEIYNRQYWFRLLDCLYDDYPGLRAILGDARFMRLATTYLEKHPSTSPLLRDLGAHLAAFLEEEPSLAFPHQGIAIETAQVEWAQVVAFDAPARRAVNLARLAGVAPDHIHFRLQPYITLLALRYPVDRVVIRSLRADDKLRSEASNAVESAPVRPRRHSIASRIRPGPTWLLVHRHENMVWFKRLTQPQFTLLQSLDRGASLAAACAAVEGLTPSPTAADIQEWFQTWTELGFLIPA